MSKYKVLLPTNGYAPGSVVELPDEVADSFNANERLPRVVLFSDEAPATETESTHMAESEEEVKTPEETPEISESNQDTPEGGEGSGDGAGAEASDSAGEGSGEAGE